MVGHASHPSGLAQGVQAPTVKQEVLASQPQSSGVVPSTPSSCLHPKVVPTWSTSS